MGIRHFRVLVEEEDAGAVMTDNLTKARGARFEEAFDEAAHAGRAGDAVLSYPNALTSMVPENADSRSSQRESECVKKSSPGRDPECNLLILHGRRICLAPIGQYFRTLSGEPAAASRERALRGNVQGGRGNTGRVPLRLGA